MRFFTVILLSQKHFQRICKTIFSLVGGLGEGWKYFPDLIPLLTHFGQLPFLWLPLLWHQITSDISRRLCQRWQQTKYHLMVSKTFNEPRHHWSLKGPLLLRHHWSVEGLLLSRYHLKGRCRQDITWRAVASKKSSITRPVWQGVATDSLKFHLGPLYLTLLRPAGGPCPKWHYGRFRGGPHTGRAACSRLLPPWIPHAVRACWSLELLFARYHLEEHCFKTL
jgi:hypothetical protein